MDTWTTLLESYQVKVYTNTLATVKSQIQKEEKSNLAVVTSVDAPVVAQSYPSRLFDIWGGAWETRHLKIDPIILTDSNDRC